MVKTKFVSDVAFRIGYPFPYSLNTEDAGTTEKNEQDALSPFQVSSPSVKRRDVPREEPTCKQGVPQIASNPDKQSCRTTSASSLVRRRPLPQESGRGFPWDWCRFRLHVYRKRSGAREPRTVEENRGWRGTLPPMRYDAIIRSSRNDPKDRHRRNPWLLPVPPRPLSAYRIGFGFGVSNLEFRS